MGYGHYRLNYPETFCDFFNVGDCVRNWAASGEFGQVTRAWTTNDDYYDNTDHFVEIRLSSGKLIVRKPGHLTKVSLLEIMALAAQ